MAGQRDHAHVEQGNTATAELLDWFDAALRDRADQPREDVLSLLAATPSEGEQRADLLANCLFFVLAGHATTTTLLTDREQSVPATDQATAADAASDPAGDAARGAR